MTDLVFEIAYFWRLDPGAVMALPLSRIDLYERQAQRIAEQIEREQQSGG